VRHEYACTAVDVLARRTRLAFVNAQAALSALPRVIEIMSEELGWNRTRQREEFERGLKYLQSMGLAPGAINNSVGEYPWDRKSHTGWTGWVADGFWCLLGMHSTAIPATKGVSQLYNRAKFEAGEVEALRDIFDRHAVTPEDAGQMPERMSVANKHLKKDRIKVVLKEFAEECPEWGYERFREGDYRYVLAEAGFHDQDDVEFDEFVEVRWLTPTNGWMDADWPVSAKDMRKPQGCVSCPRSH